MNDKILLVQGITLCYYESLIDNNKDKSIDLISKIIETVKVPELIFGMANDSASIDSLKKLLTVMNETNGLAYDRDVLLQNVKLACGDDDRLYDSFILAVPSEVKEDKYKRMIVEYRRKINSYFREKKIEELMTKVPAQFKFERSKIKDINKFIIGYIEELEKIATGGDGEKDEAILSSVDFSDPTGIENLYKNEANGADNNYVYKTGFKAVNRMLQGGIRPGNFLLVNALQHKNKTGFTLSLFRQIAVYNKPRTKDPEKKPLLLWISFEDKTEKNLRSLYIDQKYNDTGETVKIESGMTQEDFIKGFLPQMTATGFHIKMYRINPTDWTFHALFSLIMSLEADGYVLEGLFCDYLGMLPTTGCNKTGAMGTDIRDLFRRVRNFCESRGAFFVTPHQLSTDAKALIRADIPESEFVKMIAEKGYTSGSKQLDQEVDIELYIHLFSYKGETIFTIQRGKHRIESILEDESWKFVMYKFPKLMPLPSDIDREEDLSFTKLSQLNGKSQEVAETDFFDI